MTNEIDTIPMVADYYIYVIVGIMFIAGVLGGFANFLLRKEYKTLSSWQEIVWSIIGYCILGIVSSFTVPLFLNMISSNLLEQAKANQLNLLVFAGFCLIAAVFSRNFLENVYSRIMKEVKEIKKDVNEIEEASSEPEKINVDVNEDKLYQFGITMNEYMIMQAMAGGKYIYRGVTGIASDTQLPKKTIKEALFLLMDREIVKHRLNKEKQNRYYLSEKGKTIFSRIASEYNKGE